MSIPDEITHVVSIYLMLCRAQIPVPHNPEICLLHRKSQPLPPIKQWRPEDITTCLNTYQQIVRPFYECEDTKWLHAPDDVRWYEHGTLAEFALRFWMKYYTYTYQTRDYNGRREKDKGEEWMPALLKIDQLLKQEFSKCVRWSPEMIVLKNVHS